MRFFTTILRFVGASSRFSNHSTCLNSTEPRVEVAGLFRGGDIGPALCSLMLCIVLAGCGSPNASPDLFAEDSDDRELVDAATPDIGQDDYWEDGSTRSLSSATLSRAFSAAQVPVDLMTQMLDWLEPVTQSAEVQTLLTDWATESPASAPISLSVDCANSGSFSVLAAPPSGPGGAALDITFQECVTGTRRLSGILHWVPEGLAGGQAQGLVFEFDQLVLTDQTAQQVLTGILRLNPTSNNRLAWQGDMSLSIAWQSKDTLMPLALTVDVDEWEYDYLIEPQGYQIQQAQGIMTTPGLETLDVAIKPSPGRMTLVAPSGSAGAIVPWPLPVDREDVHISVDADGDDQVDHRMIVGLENARLQWQGPTIYWPLTPQMAGSSVLLSAGDPLQSQTVYEVNSEYPDAFFISQAYTEQGSSAAAQRAVIGRGRQLERRVNVAEGSLNSIAGLSQASDLFQVILGDSGSTENTAEYGSGTGGGSAIDAFEALMGISAEDTDETDSSAGSDPNDAMETASDFTQPDTTAPDTTLPDTTTPDTTQLLDFEIDQNSDVPLADQNDLSTLDPTNDLHDEAASGASSTGVLNTYLNIDADRLPQSALVPLTLVASQSGRVIVFETNY